MGHSLLTEYVQNGSERAFRDLVSNYVNFVFSTAMRMVGGDWALAEDISQTVFVDLARKADRLPENVQLGGWLHRHTCFTARKAMRREQRRVAREKRAIEMHNSQDFTAANLSQVSLVLDEVINALGEKDRDAIVLRFFDQLDFRSIAHSIGSTEDGARMRVSRAVEKMGALLRRRGVILSATAFAFIMSGRLATAAPRGLAIRSASVALAKSTAPPSFFSLIKSLFLTKLNMAILVTALVIALSVPIVLLVKKSHPKPRTGLQTNASTMTPADFADLNSTEPQAPSPAQAPTTALSSPIPRSEPVQTPVAAPIVPPPQTPVLAEAARPATPQPNPTVPIPNVPLSFPAYNGFGGGGNRSLFAANASASGSASVTFPSGGQSANDKPKPAAKPATNLLVPTVPQAKVNLGPSAPSVPTQVSQLPRSILLPRQPASPRTSTPSAGAASRRSGDSNKSNPQ